MIRINLLKSPAKHKSRKGGRPPGITASLLRAGALSLLVLCLAGGGALYLLHLRGARPERAPQAAQALLPGYKPSTLVKPDMVEDVVKEINDERSKSDMGGLLDISYDEMSTAEKINYEVLFTKYVTSMLARAVPSGIGLRTLEIDNFQSIYAVGIGASRDKITAMFSTLRREKVDLLPPPYSYIKSNGDQGFRFVVTCKAHFGLDLADPFQAIDYLPSSDDVELTLKNVAGYAAQDGVRLSGAPQQVLLERAGAYRRMVYHVAGVCSYKDFVKLVVHLYTAKVPCAFKKVTLSARGEADVDLSADLLLTVREQ